MYGIITILIFSVPSKSIVFNVNGIEETKRLEAFDWSPNATFNNTAYLEGLVSLKLMTASTAANISNPNLLVWRNDCKANTKRKCNYHQSVLDRTLLWNNRKHLIRTKTWQHHVGYKLRGYEFARSMDVLTPRVIGCVQNITEGVNPFPDTRQAYVLKPVDGFASRGVSLVLQGRAPDYSMYANKTWIRGFFAEEVVRHYSRTTRLSEYKFFMFGGICGGILIISGNRTIRQCRAWINENFERVDRFGCTRMNVCGFQSIGKKKVKYLTKDRFPPCDDEFVSRLRPPFWDEMVNQARRLSSALGVFMRIDLFASTKGPVLGEFTPFPMHGGVACITRAHDVCMLDYAWDMIYEQELERRKLQGKDDPLAPIRSFLETVPDLCEESAKARAHSEIPASCAMHVDAFPAVPATLAGAIRQIACNKDNKTDPTRVRELWDSLFKLPYVEESVRVVKKTQRRHCDKPPLVNDTLCPKIPFAI
uniref:Uncharacterized protein n=1 Tax=Aureoumbra lagunensis TaxID=44058 RepID=A0A6S8BZ69_9STRA|mmetsp:Transcript_5686/g.7346  ORF Transcript_5686/g.7346 Transcript_5686/m.7346 type:complete len:478 (+) Transcript_5686:90-1523(+)